MFPISDVITACLPSAFNTATKVVPAGWPEHTEAHRRKSMRAFVRICDLLHFGPKRIHVYLMAAPFDQRYTGKCSPTQISSHNTANGRDGYRSHVTREAPSHWPSGELDRGAAAFFCVTPGTEQRTDNKYLSFLYVC